MDEKITSRENAKIKYACRLASGAAFRRTEGRFLAEGRKLCPELARGAELETLFYTENALAKCPELAALPGEHYLVEDHVADKLADVGTHQGVFGVFRTPVHTLEEVRPGGRYLALERVQDPGNVGTILRTADAAGFDGAILGPGCADLYGAKTLRATMGSVFRVPVLPTNDLPGTLEAMKREGYAVAATELGGQDFYACCPRGKAILVIGSEGQGISKPVRDAATHHLALPMRGGAESLNAAVAAGILIYELARGMHAE